MYIKHITKYYFCVFGFETKDIFTCAVPGFSICQKYNVHAVK